MNSTSVVHEIIDRSNRRIRFWTFVVLIVVMCGFAYFSRHLKNFIQGPFPITSHEIASITNIGSEDKFYVTITGEDMFDTGYAEFEGNNVTVHFAALQFEDRLLLVKTPDNLTNRASTRFTGQLIPIPGDVRSEVLNDLLQQLPELNGSFLPFMLRTNGFISDMYIGLAFGGVLIFAGLHGLYLTIWRSLDISHHPSFNALKKFGEPNTIIPQIDQELKQKEHQQFNKYLHITKNWLINMHRATFEATPLKDVIWVYVHQTKVNSTTQVLLIIVDRYGKEIKIISSKKEIDMLMNMVFDRIPWAHFGYTDQVKKRWKKDRATMIEEVDRRRKGYELQALVTP